jgi:Holliday junction resolvasome RuvABC ATP-dependent DNA helicase subunit
MIERIVDPNQESDEQTSEEQRIENVLRPRTFKEYVGQERIKRICRSQ